MAARQSICRDRDRYLSSRLRAVQAPADEPSSRPPHRLLIAAALAVGTVIVVLAIFGSDIFGGDDTLTREEFLAEGDEICSEAHEEYAQQQQDPPQSASEAADLTANLIEISEEELESIRELGPPDELQEPLDRYLSARESGIEVMREGLEAAEAGDARAYARAQAEVTGEQVERTKLAEEVGFSECSRPPGAAATG
jgi:hypothetical protein